MADENIIPFGKYKGQPIDQVAARDPQYLQWLTQQAWFIEKFQHLTVNINNFGVAPEETPAHNAMQVRFLDENYRLAFIRHLFEPKDAIAEFCAYLRQRQAQSQKSRSESPSLSWYKKNYPEAWQKIIVGRWRERQQFRAARAMALNGQLTISWQTRSVRFEDATDVIFDASLIMATSNEDRRKGWVAKVEIKPSLGDDFPAVLRQVKRQGAKAGEEAYVEGLYASVVWVLLVGEYAGTGATLEQVRQVFAASSITLILATEVEAKLAKIQNGENP